MNKTRWHLPKVLVIFILLGLFWYLLFKAIWLIHIFIYPDHKGQLELFWQEGLSFKSFISSFFLLIPLFLPAMGLAMIVTNGLFWLIPPAKSAFEAESKKLGSPNFSDAISDLLLLFVKFLLPIGLGLSLLGAFSLASLK